MLIAEIRRKLADLDELDPEEEDVVEQVRTLLKETKEWTAPLKLDKMC